MNWKTWFYGTSMVLLMLTATCLVITTHSWEDLKGQQTVACRDEIKTSPKNAPPPSSCGRGFFWTRECTNRFSYGQGGTCGVKKDVWGYEVETGFRGSHQPKIGMITKRELKCISVPKSGWFDGCEDGATIDTTGSQLECVLSSC